MKKKLLISGISITCILLLFVAFLFYKGVFVLDHSGEYGTERASWNGADYVPCSGAYHEGKTIAKTSNGWDINEVEEDSTHTFIVFRSFLDQYLFVREDYEIPTSGTVTSVFWDDEKITDKKFCNAVSDIILHAKTDFTYETEGIYMQTDTQHMQEVYLSYNDCPIGTKFAGYMGMLEGQWVITTEISPDQTNPNGSPKAHAVSCCKIQDQYIEILETYFH